ncbi:MAG TPA: hypothetical protein VEA40_00705 [Ramlibacter sp.]|nr:hypothetical protein [Ramlibacter sp.]
MLSRRLWAAVAVAAGLAGCGGGSVGVGIGLFDDDDFRVDPDVQIVYAAVRAFDGLAGAERLLALLPDGVERLQGAPGVPVGQECPGGGTITSWKQDAVRFRLTAVNCRIRAEEGLVYDGIWAFNLTDSTIDTTNARFGYGAANQPAFGRSFQVNTPAGGVRGITVTAAEAFTFGDGVAARADGTLALLDFRSGGLAYRLAGSRSRDRLEVTAPYTASLVFGNDVTASVDRNSDGVVDRTFVVPRRVFGR